MAENFIQNVGLFMLIKFLHIISVLNSPNIIKSCTKQNRIEQNIDKQTKQLVSIT